MSGSRMLRDALVAKGLRPSLQVPKPAADSLRFSAQAALLLLASVRLNADPPATPEARPGHNPNDHPCQQWSEKIAALEDELDDIEAEKPPFDKMSPEEVKANVDHRRREIEIIEGRRSAMGCPGAAPLKDLGGDAPKPTEIASPVRVNPGTRWTPENMRDAFERYGPAGSEFEELYDDSKTRTDGGMLSFPKKETATNRCLIYGKPMAWACSGGQGESMGLGKKPIKINDVEGAVCGVGEDMAGDWGAVVYWTRHGIPLQVQVVAPYPEQGDQLLSLYGRCQEEALRIARDFDNRIR